VEQIFTSGTVKPRLVEQSYGSISIKASALELEFCPLYMGIEGFVSGVHVSGYFKRRGKIYFEIRELALRIDGDYGIV
jgi:hypothetical protein